MEFVFALKQNVGAPSVSLVKEGDLVQRGQLIATKPAGALGTYLYSSIDGKVKSITENQIIIEELNTDFDKYIPLKKKLPGELIEEAGIVGLGGAGFPTSVKLNADFPLSWIWYMHPVESSRSREFIPKRSSLLKNIFLMKIFPSFIWKTSTQWERKEL